MYKIHEEVRKLVAKARGGLPHNNEKCTGITASSEPKGSIDLNPPTGNNNIPRPVFQRRPSKRVTSTKQKETGVISPQNDVIINYINDSWNMLVAENPSDSSTKDSNANSPEESIFASSSPTVWIEPRSPELEDLKPFDLESWWSCRLFENITKDL
ncbi:uncharacterized protein LOC117897180 [Drosophila subobscura]|uniref:uncharacterized protein LOC117897180 n=1 Tax=Drosophila subobscura TaxID=7241 RepID=UPI00155B2D24|nr:uncharacterized protein LOC117897180 [Drosophila subobscura]